MMNEENNFSPIEERLRVEAGRLLVGGQRSPTELWNVYQCRWRRSAQRRCVAAISAVVLAVVVTGIVHNRQPSRPRRQSIASRAPADSQNAAAALHTAIAEASSSSTAAIPFVIGDPASGEPALSGFYVPEEIQPIDVRELSSAERDAINTVLDLDPGQENGGVI